MGLWDILPGVSQVKSIVQLACGDTKGAARTQEAFLRECPGVSQVTSVVQLVAGDTEGAKETQKRCGSTLLKTGNGLLNGTPGVGHVKGLLHYAVGDKKGGHEAMKAATRTTGVMAGGVGGFILGGPVGAVAGGISGGAYMDTATSVVTNEPYGYIAAIGSLVKNPNPGDFFDTLMMPVGDGLAGYTAGQTYNRITSGSKSASGLPNKADVQKGQAMQAKAEADLSGRLNDGLKAPEGMSEGQYQIELRKNAQLYNKGRSLQGFKDQPSTSAGKGGVSGKTQVHSGKTGQATPSVRYAIDCDAIACNENRSEQRKQQQPSNVSTNQSVNNDKKAKKSFQAQDNPFDQNRQYTNLIDQLVEFFKKLKKEDRENSDDFIEITQEIHDDNNVIISRIKTIIRVRDLYVIRVRVYSPEDTEFIDYITEQVANGENDNYTLYALRNGKGNELRLLLVPYRNFHYKSFYEIDGSLLVSQAVFISEAVRFVKNLVFQWTSSVRFNSGWINASNARIIVNYNDNMIVNENNILNILDLIKSWYDLSEKQSPNIEIPALENTNKTKKK